MSFLYCVPGSNPATVDYKKLGLDYAFEGSPRVGQNSKGLDGTESVILCDRSLPASKNKISKDDQVWKKAGSIWIGYWKDSVPTEASLRRSKQLFGRTLRLRNEDWEVPTAVSFDEADGELFSRWHLSRYVDFDDDGEPTYGDVEEQFAPLWEIAKAWMDSSEEGWTLARLWKNAGQVLGFNYRISFHEACMLQLLTDESALQIMGVCVDASGIDRLRAAVEDPQKKSSTSGVLSTSDGAADAIESTSQPSLTS